MKRRYRYVVFAVSFLLMWGIAAGNSITPEKVVSIQKSFTPTQQERINQTEYTHTDFTYENGTVCSDCNRTVSGWHYEVGQNTYLFDVSTWHTVTSQYPNGDPKDVEVTFQLEATNATQIVVGNKEPFKSLNATEEFNKQYYWKGGNATPSDIDYMRDVLDSIAVKIGGETDKTVNFKGDKPKNITAKVKLRAATNDKMVTLGNDTISITVSSVSDFNGGDAQFNGTTADGGDLLGDLRIGYRNGTNNPVADGRLAGYWRFDGDSGSVLDFSGNGTDGSILGDVTRGVSGVLSTSAFDFDGAGDGVNVTQALKTTENNNSFTINMWVNLSNDPASSDYSVLYANGFDGSTYPAHFVYDNSQFTASKQLILRSFDGTPAQAAESGVTLPLKEMVMVTLTYAGSTGNTTFFLNATQKGSDTVGTMDTSNALSKSIGIFNNRGTLEREFDGVIDEVQLYNTVLTQAQINELNFFGKDGTYRGDYNRSHSITDTPTQLQVNASNLLSQTHLDIPLEYGSESTVIHVDTNGTKNYTTGFTGTGGNLFVQPNFTTTDETETAQIVDYTVWDEEPLKKSSLHTANVTGEVPADTALDRVAWDDILLLMILVASIAAGALFIIRIV